MTLLSNCGALASHCGGFSCCRAQGVWALVFVMLCNGVLTAGAMIRYTERQTQPEPQTVIAEFFDQNYDDAWMEERWPNMRIVE